MKNLLGEGHHPGHPDGHALAQWIRFCRIVGWYFEGTVLYERTSRLEAGLGDAESAEVEEDYAACKREFNRYKRV